MPKRRRRLPGVIPKLGGALWGGTMWTLEHAQPVFLAAFFIAAVVGLGFLATRSEAFKIDEVRFPSDTQLTLPASIMGQNLWAVDLQGVAAKLRAQEPHARRVRVIRQLPNVLNVEIVRRVPVAQLHLLQWHLVDADGYILPETTPKPADDVVILKGLEDPTTPLKASKVNDAEPMRRALHVLGRLRTHAALVGHRLQSIDVSDPGQVSFTIDDDIEVRCGGEGQLDGQLTKLRSVLQKAATKDLLIRYIDLRFEDPVIGPKIG